MRTNIYMACCAMILAFVACSEDGENIGGTSTEPNTIFAKGSSLWNPSEGDLSVNTARYAVAWPENAIADGQWAWKSQSEEDDDSISYIRWPIESDNNEDLFRSVIDSCQGICGTAVLKKGPKDTIAFVNVGFVIARDEAGNPTPVDVSNWGGICITYTSDTAPSLMLDLGDSLKEWFKDGVDFPSAPLPKAPDDEVTQCVSWSDFDFSLDFYGQYPSYWMDSTGVTAAKQMVGLWFRIKAQPGEYKFNIRYIGAKEEGLASIESPKISSNPFVLEGGDGGLWSPYKDGDRVKTSLYSEVDWPKGVVEDGLWSIETDDEEGGESSIMLPVPLDDNGSFTPVVDSCKGFCGTAVLKKGDQQNNPFVTVGFGIAKDTSGISVPVDVQKWAGLCVEYYSEADLLMELVLNDSLNELLNYNLPSIKLKKTATATKICEDWFMFSLPDELENVPEVLKELPSTFAPEISDKSSPDEWKRYIGDNAAKRLVGIRFKIQAKEGSYKFGIGAMGIVRRRFLNNSDLPICIRNGMNKRCGEDLWNHHTNVAHVKTSRYAGNTWPNGVVADGRWFGETDEEMGGASSIEWTRMYDRITYKSSGIKDYSNTTSMDTIMQVCDGVCGAAILSHGTMTGDPYLSIGFNIAKDSTGNPVPVDVSNWGGICIEYTSYLPLSIELDLGDSLNSLLGAKPFASLPVNDYVWRLAPGDTVLTRQYTPEPACIRWNDFELPADANIPEEWTGKIGENATKSLKTIRFKMQSADDMENIFSIGTFSTYYKDEEVTTDDEIMGKDYWENYK